MTVRAKKLIKHATDEPANTVRVFVDALGRLGFDPESLLAGT